MNLLSPTRRHFLKTNAAVAASFMIPRRFLATDAGNAFRFVDADSCTSWPVENPVEWSLEQIREPILERASEGLLKLTTADDNRVIRLVVRRRRLNLVELHPGSVVVHHWSRCGVADLRPFFTAHGLARPEIEVVLRDRKRESTSTKAGDDFLFGDRLAASFPLDLYQRKLASRFDHQRQCCVNRSLLAAVEDRSRDKLANLNRA